MGIPFPSDEWVKAFAQRLNDSASYAEIAKNWEGDLFFQIQMPGQPEPELLYMDLWHGKCREAYHVPKGEQKKAAFILSAPLAHFVKILKGELDPIQAMVTGRLKVQGNMVMIMRNVPTVLEFVRIAKSLETDFPAA